MKLHIMKSMYRLNSDEAGYNAGETLERKSRKPQFNYITWDCNCALLTAKFQLRTSLRFPTFSGGKDLRRETAMYQNNLSSRKKYTQIEHIRRHLK